MKMYNFDFMKNGNQKPIETVSNMMRSLAEAQNRCVNLFAHRGIKIGADKVRLRENGEATILYVWPIDRHGRSQ